MRARRRSQGKPPGLSLDSLVDIVSNNVGILVLLAVVTALFALNSDRQRSLPAARAAPPPLLEVPYSHTSVKRVAYWFIQENRLQSIDLKTFYQRLAEQPSGSTPLEIDIDALRVDFFPVTEEVYCLSFVPRSGLGEAPGEPRRLAEQPGSDWQQLRAQYDGKAYTYFFWVDAASFAWFRDLRSELWKDNVEVGWKPFSADDPMSLCNGFEDASAFRPQ